MAPGEALTQAIAASGVHVPADLLGSFVTSEMGLALNVPFPIGTLHRHNFVALERWQRRYHPIVKRRTPKKRKRRGR